MSPTSLAFFSSASASFRPAPYSLTTAPAVGSSRSTFFAKSSARNHDSLVVPQSMDPQPTDPNVLFIHPPFDTFPNAHISPDGLTYNLMAENPEWFFDPRDFASQNNTNPNAIPYPPHLEPPRGWCPAKKKDLKERGGDGWPEGEEPRLRCTFCRRTYAGVNAKSMWRRHVFEKHKIAMSNRRDGNSDRPRGRSSGKENKHLVSVKHSESSDGLISIIVAPQAAPEISSQKSRFRSAKVHDSITKRDGEGIGDLERASLPFTPRKVKKVLSSTGDSEGPCETTTPPLTPHVEKSSDPPSILSSDYFTSTPPVILRPVIPESPYNPFQTPSFRHSPPRLPSAQPWRFPSPSHPLHSSSRELSLTMLTGSLETPLIKRTPTLEVSPLHSSPQSSVTQFDTSSTEPSAKLYLPLERAGNHAHGNYQRFAGSLPPFPRHRTPKPHSRQASNMSETWLPVQRLAPSPSSLPMGPPSIDPFTIYDAWPAPGTTPISPLRVAKPTVECESPVVRSGPVTGDVTWLEPFKNQPLKDDVEDDLKVVLPSSPTTLQQSNGKRSPPPPGNPGPPLKKKRRLPTDEPNP